MSEDYIGKLEDLIKHMDELSEIKLGSNNGYFYVELSKLHRILEWIKIPESTEWLHSQRKDFYLFHREYDQRKGTNFLAAFPEMKEFWELCRAASQN